MNEKEFEEVKKLFDFIDEVVGDSPHCCDDATMKWYDKTKDELLRFLWNVSR